MRLSFDSLQVQPIGTFGDEIVHHLILLIQIHSGTSYSRTMPQTLDFFSKNNARRLYLKIIWESGC